MFKSQDKEMIKDIYENNNNDLEKTFEYCLEVFKLESPLKEHDNDEKKNSDDSESDDVLLE